MHGLYSQQLQGRSYSRKVYEGVKATDLVEVHLAFVYAVHLCLCLGEHVKHRGCLGLDLFIYLCLLKELAQLRIRPSMASAFVFFAVGRRHLYVGGRDSLFVHALDLQLPLPRRQPRKLCTQILWTDPGVNKRGEGHVPTYAAGYVEICYPHELFTWQPSGDYDISLAMLSRTVFKVLARTSMRIVAAGLAAMATFAVLSARDWPWWASLPAAIIAFVAAFMTVVAVLYAYTKWSYPKRAEEIRKRLHQLSSCAGRAADARADGGREGSQQAVERARK